MIINFGNIQWSSLFPVKRLKTEIFHCACFEYRFQQRWRCRMTQFSRLLHQRQVDRVRLPFHGRASHSGTPSALRTGPSRRQTSGGPAHRPEQETDFRRPSAQTHRERPSAAQRTDPQRGAIGGPARKPRETALHRPRENDSPSAVLHRPGERLPYRPTHDKTATAQLLYNQLLSQIAFT